MNVYDIPNDVKELFEIGENIYRIIDYAPEMSLNNEESLSFFLDFIGASQENIAEDNGTQVILIHPDFGMKFVIDSSGLGDFNSHKFEVSKYEDE